MVIKDLEHKLIGSSKDSGINYFELKCTIAVLGEKVLGENDDFSIRPKVR